MNIVQKKNQSTYIHEQNTHKIKQTQLNLSTISIVQTQLPPKFEQNTHKTIKIWGFQLWERERESGEEILSSERREFGEEHEQSPVKNMSSKNIMKRIFYFI